MTINLTDVTFDLLVAEQLHDIVPCDECQDRQARWSLTCASCSHVVVDCGPCKLDVEALLARRRADGFCLACNEWYPSPLPWVAL